MQFRMPAVQLGPFVIRQRSDGAVGARAVKQAGGILVVQNPLTARYSGIPGAIAPSSIDVVADIGHIGVLLHDLLTGESDKGRQEDRETVTAMLEQIHDASGIDFSSYKQATVV